MAAAIPAAASHAVATSQPAGKVATKPQARSSARHLSQFYTKVPVAARYVRYFNRLYGMENYLMVEPSAGQGAFYRFMPTASLAYDKDPKYPGIRVADFLTVTLPTDKNVAVLGNPPFGRNANEAIAFFNHAARFASRVGFILPRTFKKASVVRRLNPYLHLVHEEEVEENAFVFEGQPYDVPTVFQIWERRAERRVDEVGETTHPDFVFTTAADADFAIRRVGANAGLVHRDFTMSKRTTYFVKGSAEVEQIMKKLPLAEAASNVAGTPSLAKTELVALYRQHTGR